MDFHDVEGMERYGALVGVDLPEMFGGSSALELFGDRNEFVNVQGMRCTFLNTFEYRMCTVYTLCRLFTMYTLHTLRTLCTPYTVIALYVQSIP